MNSSKSPPKAGRKIAVKKTDAAQSERFKKMAKELGGDESPEGFDKTLNKVAKQRETPRKG